MFELFAALLVSAGPTVHSELKPIRLRDLAGYTLVLQESGYSKYEFEAGGVAKYAGIMGATGTGKWEIDGDALEARGRGRGGPCGGEEACEEGWDWDVTLAAPARSKSGLLVLKQIFPGRPPERLVLECDAKKQCEDNGSGAVIKVMPGNDDKKLFDSVMELLTKAQPGALVKGAPAKNPREVSEVFYYGHSEMSEEAVGPVLKTIRPVAGKIQPKPWTYSKTLYDIIVVVGKKKTP